MIRKAMMLIAFVMLTGLPVKAQQTAHYAVTPAGENQTTPVSDLWLTLEGKVESGGVWWNAVMKKSGSNELLGVRILSQRQPFSAGGIGEILRYQFKPPKGQTLEYIDQSTGKALLPEFDLAANFLPTCPDDARVVNGFATTGTVLGHLMRSPGSPKPAPAFSFTDVRKLEIRTDFVIGTSRTFKDDGKGRETPTSNYNFIPWTKDDYQAMIDAGFNHFAAITEYREWLLTEPVFIEQPTVYPDDFYRSNVRVQHMYIDEPMVRLGWWGTERSVPTGPEVMAQSLRKSVAAHEKLSQRVIAYGNQMGTLDLVRAKAPSWETEFWSAWYQLQAGVPGIVHEGRYVHRGYGWEPETYTGPGVEDLDDRDHFNFIYAFMRGAARSFDGHWGTSLYGHADLDLRLPAFIRAYEMGAKNLWFWTSDHEHHMPFPEQLRLAKGITDYAKQNPRPDQKTLLNRAKVGIALPPGYAFTYWGTWGMEREMLNPQGVPYGLISSQLMWEGIVRSRAGEEFDFLVNHEGIEKLGYEQLVIIGEDGRKTFIPEIKTPRAPKSLSLKAESRKAFVDDAPKGKTYPITQASRVAIDADLSDWKSANWTVFKPEHWSGDNVFLTVDLTPDDIKGKTTFEALTGAKLLKSSEEVKAKYNIEAYPHEENMFIGPVAAGSPAEAAGLREGDMLVKVAGNDRLQGDVQVINSVRAGAQGGQPVKVEVRRSGRSRLTGPRDLAGRFAFQIDGKTLYFACEVIDDVHLQNRTEREIWMHDSVQIGFAPTFEGSGGDQGYGEQNHEIGFTVKNGKPYVYRWVGRRMQGTGPADDIDCNAKRIGDTTVYEAAIPLEQIAPFDPGIQRKIGINIVINDSDDEDSRKGRLELVPGAMTRGKHPDEFAVFEAPLPRPERTAGRIIWKQRAFTEGKAGRFDIALASPIHKQATVKTTLRSLDSTAAIPASASTGVSIGTRPVEVECSFSTASPAGMYMLDVEIVDEDGSKVTSDSQPIFIYQPD